jgi:cytochrome d ubiquinol oxidase subunit II
MVLFWVGVLTISTLLYILLDGFDLGVGILFGITRNEAARGSMISAVVPVWDGNETWLVVTGVTLWGAFPIVYATLLSAFYLPLLVMLAGLILRGVAFEFRNKTEQMRWVWDACFAGGSFVARPSQTWGLCRAPEGTTGPPFSGGVITFKGAVHHRASNLEHQVRTARRPTHLLLSIHPAM